MKTTLELSGRRVLAVDVRAHAGVVFASASLRLAGENEPRCFAEYAPGVAAALDRLRVAVETADDVARQL